MPFYKYKGKNLENQTVQGTLEAASESACYATLRADNIFAYSVKNANTAASKAYTPTAPELAEFSRQMGTMQKSGIPVVKALEIYSDRLEKKKLLNVCEDLRAKVSQGNNLSDAMRQSIGQFPELMINMYAAGESNGRLDESCIKMAEYYESENRLGIKIKGALAYPSILAVVTVAVTLFIFIGILPDIFDIIEGNGVEINALSAFIFGLSNVLINNWVLCLLGVTTLFVLWLYISHRYAEQVESLKLSVPKIGKLLCIIYTAQFARTLSSLYSSGIPMVEAVETSAKTINNKYVQKGFRAVAQRIRTGQPLSVAIADTDGMDRKLISAIYIGEETGRLDEMLTSISKEYEFESNAAIDRMLTFLEPAMLIFMGVIIGTVLVAVMMPLMQLYGSF